MYLCLGVLVLVCVEPFGSQSTGSPVVNVQVFNHPNNVVRVPEYENTGKINVELSEDVRFNQVEVTCITSPLGTGLTTILLKKATISVGSRSGTVLFDVLSPGRIVEVRCSGQSNNNGSQFQTATSVGSSGYVQVTKRPTVSVCSDVIVVPMDNTSSRTVEVLFSENVTTHPVSVACSVLSPVKVNSVPMKLKFFAKSAPVMAMKIKVSYELQSKGDPVIVACHANSTSSTTRVQYTFGTSQGNTAIFTFQMPQATFIPASITSLGRTTSGRTVSYLVLEKRATNFTQFQCSLMAHDPTVNPVSSCSVPGGGSQTTNLELTSVAVNLVTTNMTFEIDELFKPLVIQVNGTSTQREQRLLDVTCCRKNADPKYFVLATTISLWIDVFPNVQFTWSNVSETNTATPYFRFNPQCPCDLGVTRCDIGCCCDKDCTSVETQAFPCIPGFFGGASTEAVFEYGCQETYPRTANYLALLCVVTNNNPFLGMLYEFTSSPAEDTVQFGSLKAVSQGSPYEYSESESRLLNNEDASSTSGGYRDGISVMTNTGFLTLSQGIAGGACARFAPVSFLRNSDAWCSGEFSESMCSETSPWSPGNYLVPSNAHRSSCITSPQVLSFNSRDNSTEAPTEVVYFCKEDVSEFTIAVGQEWDSWGQERSLFEQAATTGGGFAGDPRCPFDDGVSKPAVPRFNASLGMCSNVVLKVEYDLYWRGAQIVQVRVKITLGDVRASRGSRLFVVQRFSVKFIHLKDVDRSRVPFIESLVMERSGNPGYVIGKKVLAKIEKDESVVLDFAPKVNQTTSGELELWSPASGTGLCNGARTSPVSFGVNAMSGCLVKLSLDDMANCSKLRETVLRSQRRLVRATHVGRRGNAVLNKSDDWLPLLWPPSPYSWLNNSGNQTFGICKNVPAGLHYELLVKEAGKFRGIPQTEITGARITYSLHSWTFHCINHNCKLCNVNNTNDTAPCISNVQSFDVTSSVAFITVLGKEMSRQKRSADTSDICHQDTCAAELFYPLTTSYDGEKREVTIAYGLMLFALLLAILALTTSCLRFVRQWIAL